MVLAAHKSEIFELSKGDQRPSEERRAIQCHLNDIYSFEFLKKTNCGRRIL
jgi:hypothetical protein